MYALNSFVRIINFITRFAVGIAIGYFAHDIIESFIWQYLK